MDAVKVFPRKRWYRLALDKNQLYLCGLQPRKVMGGRRRRSKNIFLLLPRSPAYGAATTFYEQTLLQMRELAESHRIPDPYALNILALRPKLAISQGHKHNIGSKCDKLGEEPFS